MNSKLLDGRALAKQTRAQLAQLVARYTQGSASVRPPTLAVILIGDLAASRTYVAAKQRACDEIGVRHRLIHLPPSLSREELKAQIDPLNSDPNVDGILVQLPLPQHLDPVEVASWLDPGKDVDGLCPLNLGKLACGDPTAMVACTPKAVVRLLDHYQLRHPGVMITLVGRSLIVGRPLSILLTHPSWSGQATLCLAHSHSHELESLCRQAQILICAVGKPRMLTERAIAPGAVVIDVGINRTPEGALCGDIDEAAADRLASWRTPVPGGVGPMTVAMLLENLLIAWSRHLNLTFCELS